MSGKTINGVDLERYNAISQRMNAKAAMIAACTYRDSVKNGSNGKKEKRKVKKPLDANRKKVLQIIARMRAEGETFDKIAIFLGKENLQTFSGRGQWHAQTVHRLYEDHIAP